MDGVRFEDIETYGVQRSPGELVERLRENGYCPEAVKRVWIPKPNSKRRHRGIPTIAHRVVQTAAALVPEPAFEANLQPEHAYRTERDIPTRRRGPHRASV